MKTARTWLEIQPDGKLQLPHASSVFDIGNLSVVTALAVDTRLSTIVPAKRVDRVIEDVESVHAELGVQSLCNPELFYD